MTKFFGVVGYGDTIETSPGVWEVDIEERKYYGDVISNSRRWEKSEYQNDNLNINNSVSILADPYAFEHAYAIRYVEMMGAKWKVTNIEFKRPRLILTLGGIYNGVEVEDEETS